MRICGTRRSTRGRGSLLDSEDLTVHDDVDDLEATLTRRTISQNFAPPAFVLITPNPVNDGSSYRALAFPTESLNDADRTLVDQPGRRTGLAVRLA